VLWLYGSFWTTGAVIIIGGDYLPSYLTAQIVRGWHCILASLYQILWILILIAAVVLLRGERS
jgi:hypothetical protein